jgi:hypothetical protein
MSATKTNSASLFRDLADAVDRLGEARVRSILREGAIRSDHKARPSLVASKKGSHAQKPIRRELVNNLAHQLRTLSSMEIGHRQIEAANLTRRELEALARSFDVPIRKDTKASDLADLVVNVTIGGRLNSAAIRGVYS